MASLKIDYRRPCLVDGKKAMFHCWSNISNLVSPSALFGGDVGGTVSKTLGIVEFEDGTVTRVLPESIRFVDGGGFDEVYYGEVDNEN